MRPASLSVTLIAAALVLALAAGGCEAPDVSAASRLLQQYGWEPAGQPERQTTEVGDLSQPPWFFYLDASRAIGRDFSASANQSGTIVTYRLAGAGDSLVRGHVLFIGDAIVGAWLSVEGLAPGVFALDSAPSDLKSGLGR